MRTKPVSLTASLTARTTTITEDAGVALAQGSRFPRWATLAACIALASAASGCAVDEGDEELVDEDVSALIGAKDSSAPSSAMLFLLDETGRPQSYCSAVQVAANVLLTAAHCVTDPNAAHYGVFYGQTIRSGKPVGLAPVRATAGDPAFNARDLGNGHDIGLVLLASKGNAKTYPINRSPITSKDFQKKAVLSGYGEQDHIKGTFTGGERQQLKVRLNGFMVRDGATYPNVLEFGSETQGACHGDSGGPALMSLGGKTRVIGATSFGLDRDDAECIGRSYYARTDTSLAFIDGTAAAWGVKLAR